MVGIAGIQGDARKLYMSEVHERNTKLIIFIDNMFFLVLQGWVILDTHLTHSALEQIYR